MKEIKEEGEKKMTAQALIGKRAEANLKASH